MATNLPDIYTGVAFNSEPFDPSGVPIWTDLSVRYYGTGSATRGRDQYELDQGQTGTADVTWYDQDEALNPSNPSSPYYPNVVPYRPLLWRLMWPAGGTGNAIKGSIPSIGADGSFESEPVGTGSGWIFFLTSLAGVGGTVVGVVGAGAWQGVHACQLAISGGITRPGGAYFTMPLIPGRVYTAQGHVNQTSATPFQLAIANQTITVDPFNRVVALNSGWGTPSGAVGFGGAWVCSPSNTGFGVSSGIAFMSQSAVNARLTAFTTDRATNHAVQDSDQWITMTIPVVATGQAIQFGLYSRYASGTDNLLGIVSFNTDQSVTVTAQKLVGGVTTTIGTNAVVPGGYQAGDSFRIHTKVIGPDIWLKAWKVNLPVPEPVAWTTQGSDNSVVAPGQLGVTSILTTGNTNGLPVLLTFSDYRAIGSIVDTSSGTTSTSGAYVQLNVTFTATQPLQQIQFKMQAAPAGANTVLIDGLQVEPGATANTFTTTGPTIRSAWTRGYIERWPAQWDADSNGYLGIMSGPVVGPFFQLANATLHAEYRASVMAKSPRYYWLLNETASTVTAFGEQSGNGGTSLYRLDAVEGPATAFAPGTTLGMAGDPNGVGLSITGDGLPGVPTSTILITGDAGLGQQLMGLGGTGAGWSFTMAFWLSSPTTPALINDDKTVMLASDVTAANATRFTLSMGNAYLGTNQGPFLDFGNFTSGFVTPRPLSTSSGLDGRPHLYVGTVSLAANLMTMSTYYDGTLIGTNTGNMTTIFGTATPNSPLVNISVAGTRVVPGAGTNSIAAGIIGTYAHLALWDRALSAAEIADLAAAGLGYPGENSGTRVARYVALSGLIGVTGSAAVLPGSGGTVDIGQGMTTMGPATLQEGDAALEAIQDVQDTEFGNFYESQEGVAFRGRQARYLAVVPSYVFGEDVAGGEWPYLGDIVYDNDATYVWNSAVITRTGGAIATATDTTGRSQMRYGSKTFTRTVGGNSDLEAQDAATYVVANSKDARPRVAAVTFDAGATRGVTASPDGTLWPMLTKLEPGVRVTCRRRPKAANGGAGLLMSSDFFIEGITPNQINVEGGTYLVTVLMSPAPVTAQPWILEDATWGQLDVTTVLGF